eukprot:CAMPEP_0172533724 /NCGR_PEP_ID=MMETSP1067-20121228/6324_1 /TAXON_ID=265564 ORGANISM="Thalassiosira punctigera, Strain Tpunct2005C2" /NCGR_SAMPLE_ID=MMETSP1067 /ASSEMBLY_ACC=CAM_ASM_000444 /LENGTH=323 /DNA_ID=CAMNT_0013318397 /DNA_START=4 /DNA_END=975 /DNA_ORIENTATION=+
MALIDDILKAAGFSSSEIADVKAGKLHQGGSLDAASERELSVKLAFHVNAKLENAKEIFLENPKKKEYDPSVEELGMIAEDGGEGSLDDFAGIKLSNAKVMDKLYMKAAPGSDLNLSKEEIAAFKKCRSHDDVENALRRALLDRFRAYKRAGLDGIRPYARSRKEFSPGAEMRAQCEAGRILPKYSPAFDKFVREYPNHEPEAFEESFFWVNSIIDDKPTIALVHRVGMPQDGGYVYMERHFYLSRSHNCLQGIGAALPVDDGGVVLYATRTSTDQVSGFGGSAKRGIGNKLMGGRMAQNFERARKVIAEAAAAKEGMDNLKL